MKKRNPQTTFRSNHASKSTFWLILSALFFGTGCDGMNGCAGDGPSFPNKDKCSDIDSDNNYINNRLNCYSSNHMLLYQSLNFESISYKNDEFSQFSKKLQRRYS